VRSIVAAVLLVISLAACTGASVPAPQASAAVPAQGPEARSDDERAAVTAVDQFWKNYFARTGQQYAPPKVFGGYRGTNGPACGGEPSVPGNALYCVPGDFLAWDEDLMAAGYRQIGDAWVYLIIAHEWGHAIQARIRQSQVSVAAELQADCLAGAALQGAADEGLLTVERGDSREITRALTAVADDFPWTDETSHGDAQQRTGAFNKGAGGGVGACV
jgi:uncharacterized protein